MLHFLDSGTLSTIAVFLLSLLIWWLIKKIFQRRHLPPGPFPLPVLGNFHHVRKHKSLADYVQHMCSTYGKIFQWTMGPYTVVHLCDLKLIQEAFVKKSDIFSNRPTRELPLTEYLDHEFGSGIANNNGPEHKEIKKICLTAMRDFGVGKKSLEAKIQEEISLVLNYIGQQNGRPHCYKPLMIKATSNVICSVVFGDRFDYEDHRFMGLLNHVGQFFSGPNGILSTTDNFFPWLFPVLSVVQGLGAGAKALEATKEHLKELSKDHEASFDPKNIRDFVDLMISYRKKNQSDQKVHDLTLQRVILDLFIAGSDTTANSLYWALLYMAAHQDVQTKCQQEIDAVVGRSRSVSLTDKPNLKYVEATILETLRMGIVASFSLLHYTNADTTLAGFKIPKHSIVQASIATVCRDTDLWSEPDKFEPRRFLDEHNNLINKEKLLNFSVGPRSCVGEILAKIELSLIFPSIIQHFHIRPGSKDTAVNLDPYEGLSRQGREQDLILVKS